MYIFNIKRWAPKKYSKYYNNSPLRPVLLVGKNLKVVEDLHEQ